MKEFEPSSGLGIGNGGVRAKFETWNRERRSLSKVRSFESEMEEFKRSSEAWNREFEEFEPSSRLGIGYGGV